MTSHSDDDLGQPDAPLLERRPSADVVAAGTNPVIVHSHLRWDFVWQRPQQILSRLSQTRRILFVEEPLWLDDASRPSLHVTEAMHNIHRVIPRLPSSMRERSDEADIAVRTMLKALLGEVGELAGKFRHPVQWFYTPMAAPAMLDAFHERAVVYDCMDELSKFRFAPAQLVLRERYLLSRADVVFTGGRRLYEAKSRHHDNVHFYGCGVEVAHFGRALDPDTKVAPEIAALPGPVLGYFGVIDERLDYALITELAQSFPEASVAMVGPVAKVEPHDLPQASNIHWLGQRDYADLPAIVKGFDVCLMPFALNAATEYINPTKTLEYMAAGRPIVSTAVADVVRNFGSLVQVADSPKEFVDAVRTSTNNVDLLQLQRAAEHAALSSWDRIVDEISRHVDRAVAGRSRGARSMRAPAAAVASDAASACIAISAPAA
ncbi:MAG: glycosyltransferase, partial [Gemmatimonadaceae bacterium]